MFSTILYFTFLNSVPIQMREWFVHFSIFLLKWAARSGLLGEITIPSEHISFWFLLLLFSSLKEESGCWSICFYFALQCLQFRSWPPSPRACSWDMEVTPSTWDLKPKPGAPLGEFKGAVNCFLLKEERQLHCVLVAVYPNSAWALVLWSTEAMDGGGEMGQVGVAGRE